MKNKVIVTHQRYRYSKPVNRYEFFLDSNFKVEAPEAKVETDGLAGKL